MNESPANEYICKGYKRAVLAHSGVRVRLHQRPNKGDILVIGDVDTCTYYKVKGVLWLNVNGPDVPKYAPINSLHSYVLLKNTKNPDKA